MNTGYIKLFRKFQNWEWFGDSKTVHLFIYLLINANHKKRKWQGVDINRGQLVTGRKKLSAITGISEQSIRTCLVRLESTNEITIESTNRFSTITICNYEAYQFSENKSTNKLTNISTSGSTSTATSTATTTKKKRIKENNYYPEWLDMNLWKEFKKMRVSIKAPLTENAEKRAISKLGKLIDSGCKQNLIIEQSIDCCWKGLFEPTQKTKKESSAWE